MPTRKNKILNCMLATKFQTFKIFFNEKGTEKEWI